MYVCMYAWFCVMHYNAKSAPNVCFLKLIVIVYADCLHHCTAASVAYKYVWPTPQASATPAVTRATTHPSTHIDTMTGHPSTDVAGPLPLPHCNPHVATAPGINTYMQHGVYLATGLHVHV